jgi:PKD repeat protein
LSNNLDNSFMTTFVLANLPSNLTSWEWKGKLEDNTRKKYQPNTNITVTLAATPPVADFSGTPTSGSTPLVVSFTDESTGSRSSWLWNFGDGNTSTAQSPSHTYSAAGSYDVTLTATNAEGSDTLGRTGYITVTMPPLPVPPVAAFSSAPTSGNAPLPVSFTDQSTGSPTTWSWDFGDGNSSTAQNPTHTYGTPGTYSVVLTVSNPQGSDSLTLSNYITVNTGGFTGQGFILSKNADFSTDDRIFSRTDTLYMLMWSDVVDFNNMKKAEFELMDTKRRKVRQNLSNNLDNSFTMTVVLADLPSNLTSWEWKGKLEDNTRKKYQPNTNITVN